MSVHWTVEMKFLIQNSTHSAPRLWRIEKKFVMKIKQFTESFDGNVTFFFYWTQFENIYDLFSTQKMRILNKIVSLN